MFINEEDYSPFLRLGFFPTHYRGQSSADTKENTENEKLSSAIDTSNESDYSIFSSFRTILYR
jgi:hypothetical protein